MFETVFRLIGRLLIDGCVKENVANPNWWVRLSSDPVGHSVHRSPCSFHHIMRNVLSGNRCVFRHVPRRPDRPSLNAVNAADTDADREKY